MHIKTLVDAMNNATAEEEKSIIKAQFVEEMKVEDEQNKSSLTPNRLAI